MSLHWKRSESHPSESSGTHTNGYSTRPTAGIKRKPSANTRYMEMLLDLDSVPKWHNITVSICAWLLLAGFVIFPGTFTSIQNINPEAEGYTDVERWIVTHVRNLPLLVVAGVCCGIGALGMVAFWVRWRANYVWVGNRVFMVSYHSHRDYYSDAPIAWYASCTRWTAVDDCQCLHRTRQTMVYHCKDICHCRRYMSRGMRPTLPLLLQLDA